MAFSWACLPCIDAQASALCYPLFILVACKSDPLRAYREGAHLHRSPLPLPVKSATIRPCYAPTTRQGTKALTDA